MLTFLKEKKTMEILFLTLMLFVLFFVYHSVMNYLYNLEKIHPVYSSFVSMWAALFSAWLLSFIAPDIYSHFINKNSQAIFRINVVTVLLAFVNFSGLILFIPHFYYFIEDLAGKTWWKFRGASK